MNTATTAAELPPGTVIEGTYTTGAVVRTRLGAVTYEARDLSGARVDVTVYAPECFHSPVALERSLRELRQIEKVNAPQVMRTRDAGKMPKGGIYEVHEHVDGVTLAEGGPIPRSEIAGLIHEIVAGLQAAQKVGVLHRNLGAEAILRVGKTSRPSGPESIRLIGFAVGDPQGGVSFGALDCIAPEQVEGKNIDERTLVYNLAALTYRLLRGASLFTGGDTGTQLLQAAASLPPPESMPPALFAALAKDPKQRPNLLAKFLGELDGIIRDFPEGAFEEETRREPSGLHSRRSAPEQEVDADEGPPPAPLFSLDPLPDPEEQSRTPAVREAPPSEPAVSAEPPAVAHATRSEERDEDATLDALMTDHDAPKLPSPAATAGPAAVSPAPAGPAAVPLAPITPPAAAVAPPAIGGPPSVGPKTGVPSIGAPPGLSSKPAPTLAPPPTLGKPGAPSFGPPTIGKPGAPSVTPPTLSAPTLSPPTLSAPTLPTLSPPSATPPVATAPAQPQAGAAKPRTRGWTMFMEVTEEEANAPSTPGQAQPAPAPVAPVAATAATPSPTPAPGPTLPGGEVKPSTRGWTMIMDEPSEADAAALALTTPAAAVATAPPPSPTTRGWTMLEELNDSLPAGAVPATPTPAQPTSGVASEVSAVSNAPSSRGWTMFMEAELQGGGGKPEEQSAEPAGDGEPEFFDGPVQTESGTVVAFAPTAADPNASFRREPAAGPDLSGQEPMTSFGARLRGEDKPASKVEDEVPQPRPAPVESAPSPAADIPSFAGNNLGFMPVNPDKPIQRPVEPDAINDADVPEPTAGGSNKAVIIGAVVFLVIVIAIILATRGG